MHPVVSEAVAELETAFAEHYVKAVPDGEGGAFIRVDGLFFGPQYKQSTGWVAFHINHAYPHTDVYPHYLPAALEREDNRSLGEAFHKQAMALGPFSGAATMVSRRSNRWNPGLDTATIKLAKVLDWIRTRP